MSGEASLTELNSTKMSIRSSRRAYRRIINETPAGGSEQSPFSIIFRNSAAARKLISENGHFVSGVRANNAARIKSTPAKYEITRLIAIILSTIGNLRPESIRAKLRD